MHDWCGKGAGANESTMPFQTWTANSDFEVLVVDDAGGDDNVHRPLGKKTGSRTLMSAKAHRLRFAGDEGR